MADDTLAVPDLDAAEQRVLGSLLEKEVTVPGSYPMTVNAVRTACNQASSRDPVADYEERHVQEVLRALKERDLVVVTWADSGRRTLKYAQRLSVLLDLSDDERALLTVLLLRGPQPPGALRSMTERLHAFVDRAAVEDCLERLAAADPPLVRQLPRRPREKDARWVHLLGATGEHESGESYDAGATGADRESVLAAGGQARDERVRASYDTVAPAYADHLVDELDHLPFERWLLHRTAGLAGRAPVVEVGCGPGHVTAYLAAAGADATGVDLAPAMVEEARRRFPQGSYQVGDLRQLMRPPAADGWGAVLAWYSLIHLAPSELPAAVAALVRPLASDGWLVLAVHAGSDLRTAATWFEHEVDLGFVFHEPEETAGLVGDAGLVDVEWYRRGPVVARGEQTQRLYVLARKP